MLIKLVLRNIWAHKLRSLIISIIIIIVTSIMFLFMSFSDGEIEGITKAFYGYSSPYCDIVITKKGYDEAITANDKQEDIIKLTITDYPAIVNELKNFTFIINAYAKNRSTDGGIILNGKKYPDFYFNGINIMSDYVKENIKITTGNYFEQTSKKSIILHDQVRMQLGVKVGDLIKVNGNDLFGQSYIYELKVIGFFKPIFDNPNFSRSGYVDFESYPIISGLYKGETHFINIDLKKGTKYKDAVIKLTKWAQSKNFDIEFGTYDKIYLNNGGSIGIYKTIRIIFLISVGLIMFIVMLGLMNVISVNLKDRKKEIGSYYCLGAERSYLVVLYTLEIFVVNIISTIFGIFAGLGIRSIINGLNITTTDPGIQLVICSEKFYLGLSVDSLITIFVLVTLITLLTSVVSLAFSLKVSPSVAIREVED